MCRYTLEIPINSVESVDWFVYYDWHIENVTNDKTHTRPAIFKEIAEVLYEFEKRKEIPLMALICNAIFSHHLIGKKRILYYDPVKKQWEEGCVDISHPNKRWKIKEVRSAMKTNPILSPELSPSLKKSFYLTLNTCKGYFFKKWEE